MRLPTKENPDPLRKPDNNREVFADGEFGDFIQPIFDTLDLYHNQEVDPRAIAISFKQLAENNPEANLEIVAMEKRGENKFLLRAKTSDSADKSELSNEYFTTYNQIRELPEREIQLLLAEKDSRIRSLETMVMTALERPPYYSSTNIGNINNIEGDKNEVVQRDTTMTGDRTINTGGGNYNEHIKGNYIQGNDSSRNVNISGGTVNASGAGALSLGDISGTVANTINQLPSTSKPDEPGIKELLEQLKTAIESESNLNDEDKADALDYVQTLAEVGQKSQEVAAKKPAKVAIQALKGILSSLPDVAELAEAGKTLIPLIANIFGL
jgi:hypothetical protein